MKTAIIKASQLGLDCWSPNRFVGSCDTCSRVMRCKLPEAREGRVKLLNKRIEKARLAWKKVKAEKTKILTH